MGDGGIIPNNDKVLYNPPTLEFHFVAILYPTTATKTIKIDGSKENGLVIVSHTKGSRVWDRMTINLVFWKENATGVQFDKISDELKYPWNAAWRHGMAVVTSRKGGIGLDPMRWVQYVPYCTSTE